MATQVDLLPVYPGYAIGSLITRKNYLLPILQKKCQELQKERELAENAKNEKIESPTYTSGGKELQTRIMAVALAEVNRVTKDYISVCERIDQLCGEGFSTPIQEALPIDLSVSRTKSENRSFPSERMHHLLFTREAEGDSDTRALQEKVEKFVIQLFSSDGSATSLPSRAIEGLAQNIGNALKTEDQISLVGSFITLPRVVTMDPVKFRRDSKVSSNLIKNAREYYVLTEAVLGAVFLGLGRSSSSQSEVAGPADESRALLSRLATISFISQGIIPKPSRDAQDVNLWGVYTQWKESLLTDAHSGYPIGFRVRELRDVLIENGIEVEEAKSGSE